MNTLKTPSNPDASTERNMVQSGQQAGDKMEKANASADALKNERTHMQDDARNRGGQTDAKPAAQKGQAEAERNYSKASTSESGTSGGMKGQGAVSSGKNGGMLGEGA